MNIFEELLWPQFVRLDRIRKLPLNEQVVAYNQYVYDLSLARQNWLNYQNKGPLTKNIVEETFYLLQEDGGLLLQENNFNITIE
jgi:hypothetical protein